MKIKHTKGDWTHYTQRNGMYIYSDNKRIATVNRQTEQGEGRTIFHIEEEIANLKLIAHAPELLQMVYDLKQCIKRLSQDGLSQQERDIEAQWEGEAHELLSKINSEYYNNANQIKFATP